MSQSPWGPEEAWTPSPCAEAGLTSSPTDAGGWELGSGVGRRELATFAADLIIPVCVGGARVPSLLLNPNHIRNKPLLGPLLIIRG